MTTMPGNKKMGSDVNVNPFVLGLFFSSFFVT